MRKSDMEGSIESSLSMDGAVTGLGGVPTIHMIYVYYTYYLFLEHSFECMSIIMYLVHQNAESSHRYHILYGKLYYSISKEIIWQYFF